MPRLLLGALLLLALTLPASAAANPSMLSIMMDDDQLLYRGDDARDTALKTMKRLGVDYVRVTVLWEVVAENARSTAARRRRFKADNPATYPPGNWDRYDRLVRAGQTLGVGIYFNVTGPGPDWAHKKAPRRERVNQRTWMPKPKEYFKLVKALGLRYGGAYPDENDGGRILPRVNFWSIWNEPNQGGWLTPQHYKGIPYAPVMYRELWRQGRAALDQTGHKDDIVLIGETAPLGSRQRRTKSPMYPKHFIRELFCVSRTGSRYTGSAASRRGCSNLAKVGTFRATAWGHHPYTKNLPPTQRDKNRDSLTMANISELASLLDQMGAKTNRIAKANATMLTEFGFETDPPDPFNGVSLAKQAEYNNVGDYLAYKDPRIVAQTQFLLRDVLPVKGARKNSKQYWFTYQSGIFEHGGKPKPAAGAYAMPFHVTGRGVDSVGASAVTFWGMLRFLPNSVRSEVRLQYRPLGGTQFSTIGDAIPVTNAFGFWEAPRAAPGPGTWRAVWVNPVNGVPQISREINVQ